MAAMATAHAASAFHERFFFTSDVLNVFFILFYTLPKFSGWM
jgi:hypothetical protein